MWSTKSALPNATNAPSCQRTFTVTRAAAWFAFILVKVRASGSPSSSRWAPSSLRKYRRLRTPLFQCVDEGLRAPAGQDGVLAPEPLKLGAQIVIRRVSGNFGGLVAQMCDRDQAPIGFGVCGQDGRVRELVRVLHAADGGER